MKKMAFILALIITLLLFIQNFTSKPESIKIGLVAGLSGKYSSLGTNVKNGVLLAFDEIDYKINDTKVELLQKDDKQDAKSAKKIIQEFIKDEVKLIIGNSTSSMTEVSLDAIKNTKDMLLFSPTASSDKFSFQDDNFIRTQVANNHKKFQNISKYFVQKKKSKIITFYDPNNSTYSQDYINNFQKAFIQNGGEKFVASFSIEDSYKSIRKQLDVLEYDAMIFTTNAIDSAKLIQYLKLNRIDKMILCSDWAMSLDFIEEGGKSVEGVLFNTSYDHNSQEEMYLKFEKDFIKKFNKKPSVFSIQAYETAKILIGTLKEDSDIYNVKKNIIHKKSFQGLQGNIVFNEFGDVYREYFIVTVKDGKYMRVNSIE